MNTTEKLVTFVNQKPGLDFSNYGEMSSYRSEMRNITNDRQDFFELLALAQRRIERFNEQLHSYLVRSSGRLTINDKGQLEYCTGQYFPTEYRPAANRVLANLIFADYRDEKDKEGNPVYKTGHDIRRAIGRNLSRRITKGYFN